MAGNGTAGSPISSRSPERKVCAVAPSSSGMPPIVTGPAGPHLSKLGTMSADSTTSPASTGPAGITTSIRELASAPDAPAAPPARQVPFARTFHGDTVNAPYAWLAAKDDPDTIAFLNAENDYTEALTAGEADLRDAIFGEIKGRTQETDLSAPVRGGDWCYYARTVEGQQYGLNCRRAVRPDDDGPPLAADGAALPGEQILLDGNELAAGHDFFSLGALKIGR